MNEPTHGAGAGASPHARLWRYAFSMAFALAFALVFLASFRAFAAAPNVTTNAASGITTSSAQLNGTVNPNGAATLYHFRYATTTPGACLRRALRPWRPILSRHF